MLVKKLSLKNLRISKRELNEQRRIQFKSFDNMLVVQTKDSCVYLSYSKTKVKPYWDKPSEGMFQVIYQKGKKNDSLVNFLHNVYIRSKCVSTKDLCIRTGQEVYFVNIEILPIQTNGDLFRLCIEGINEIIRLLELKVYFSPKVIQFACIENTVVVDPEDKENIASRWGITVAMKSTREFLYVEKTGKGVGATEVLDAVDKAMQLVSESR